MERVVNRREAAGGSQRNSLFSTRADGATEKGGSAYVP